MTHDATLRGQALRYLGHRGQELGLELEARVDEACVRCESVACPAVVRRTFGRGDLWLPGKDIDRHLAGAREVVAFAATLGHDVDRELRRLGHVDPLGQVIFDAVATALVERLANKTEASVRDEARARGMFCSWRFSPGYGDLPLDAQPGLLAALDATRRVGITLTASRLMVPTKSVTALMGVHPTPQPPPVSSCSLCGLSAYCDHRACAHASPRP